MRSLYSDCCWGVQALSFKRGMSATKEACGARTSAAAAGSCETGGRARTRWLQARSAGSAGGTCTHTARPPHLSRGQRQLQEQQSYAGLQAAQHTRGVWHRVDTRLWAPFVGGRHFALCPPFALTAFPGRISGCAAIATWGRRPALETGTPLAVNWPPGRLWSHRWETGVSGGLFESRR